MNNRRTKGIKLSIDRVKIGRTRVLHGNIVNSNIQGPGDGLQFAGLLSPADTKKKKKQIQSNTEKCDSRLEKLAQASPPVFRHQLDEVIY